MLRYEKSMREMAVVRYINLTSIKNNVRLNTNANDPNDAQNIDTLNESSLLNSSTRHLLTLKFLASAVWLLMLLLLIPLLKLMLVQLLLLLLQRDS